MGISQRSRSWQLAKRGHKPGSRPLAPLTSLTFYHPERGRGAPETHSGGVGGHAGPLLGGGGPGVLTQGWGGGLLGPGPRTELPVVALSVSMAAWREPASVIRRPEEQLLKIVRASPGSLAAGLLAARYPRPALLPLRSGAERRQGDVWGCGEAQPGPGPSPCSTDLCAWWFPALLPYLPQRQT